MKINKLSSSQQSETDKQKLEALETTRRKLESRDEDVADMSRTVSRIRTSWGQSISNEKAALQAADSQTQKFTKRWSEFCSAINDEEDVGGEPGDTSGGNSRETHGGTYSLVSEIESQAKQISVLKHKLEQSVERVRQSESTRVALNEAMELNQHLQTKLEEIKTKYSILQSNRVNVAAPVTTPNQGVPAASTKGSAEVDGTTKDKDLSGDRTVEKDKYEKLKLDFRKLRKELGLVTNSRDTAKSKLERAEKEREALVSANTRLLEQSAEKDEMNAKSLSTILHLKSMTEQLSQEKDGLEQQARTANQMAVAARLACNAKDKVSEEVLQENERLESRVKDTDEEHAATKEKLKSLVEEAANREGKLSVLQETFAKCSARNDELVTENAEKSAESRSLVDSLSRMERESKDLQQKVGGMMTGTNGDATGDGSNFTVNQLNTQISVLKGRLSCPVCHYRDKECIIMRCRHMHCKQCVEERISNRSRKCPTCNNKFSEKDVEDIWLS